MGISPDDYPYEKVRRELDKLHSGDTFRLAICVPSTAMVHALFMVDLFAVGLQMGMTKIDLPWVKKQRAILYNKQASLIHSSRQMLVLDAISHGATHILFVDSDQTFPPDTVHRLAKHDKLFVGANIVTKEIPARPCAIGLDGRTCYTDPESSGLEEVAICGTGLILLNTKLFGLIAPPLFEMPYNAEKKIYLGEDIYFCNKVRQAGVKVFIDHDLSKEVGHVGCFTYKHEYVGETTKETNEARTAALREIIWRPEEPVHATPIGLEVPSNPPAEQAQKGRGERKSSLAAAIAAIGS